MNIHKVEIENGRIVRLNKGEYCKDFVYIASLNTPKVDDRVSRYFTYNSLKECLEVLKNYHVFS